MKQDLELTALLEGQSQDQCDAFAPTLASEVQAASESRTMPSVQVSENCKYKLVRGSVVNGYIVYTRE